MANHEAERVDYTRSLIRHQWHVTIRYPDGTFHYEGLIHYQQRQEGQDKGHWRATVIFLTTGDVVEIAHCQPPSEEETEQLWHKAKTRKEQDNE